jgi:hypothetical protein
MISLMPRSDPAARNAMAAVPVCHHENRGDRSNGKADSADDHGVHRVVAEKNFYHNSEQT